MKKIKNASIIVLLLLIPSLSWTAELGEYDDLNGKNLFCMDNTGYNEPTNTLIKFTGPKLVTKDPDLPNSNVKTYKYFAEFTALVTERSDLKIYSGTIVYRTSLDEIWFSSQYARGDNQYNIRDSDVKNIRIDRQFLTYERSRSKRIGKCILIENDKYDYEKHNFKQQQTEFREKARKGEELKKKKLEENQKL